MWAALVFGVLNTILKPILRLLTLPFAIVTLGLAWFFVSMLMLWLTALIVDSSARPFRAGRRARAGGGCTRAPR